MAGSMGNPLLAIGDALPARLAEARDERDKLVGRVLELNQEIATLETVRQVAPAKLPLPLEPVTTGPVPVEPEPRRRHRIDRDPPELAPTGTPAP